MIANCASFWEADARAIKEKFWAFFDDMIREKAIELVHHLDGFF